MWKCDSTVKLTATFSGDKLEKYIATFVVSMSTGPESIHVY